MKPGIFQKIWKKKTVFRQIFIRNYWFPLEKRIWIKKKTIRKINFLGCDFFHYMFLKLWRIKVDIFKTVFFCRHFWHTDFDPCAHFTLSSLKIKPNWVVFTIVNQQLVYFPSTYHKNQKNAQLENKLINNLKWRTWHNIVVNNPWFGKKNML